MNVALGISIAHNGSVALICDGEVKIAIQAERISRRKREILSGSFLLLGDVEMLSAINPANITQNNQRETLNWTRQARVQNFL